MATGDHPLQFPGHPAQILHPGLDISQMTACQPIYVHAGHLVVPGQLQQAADLFQTETQIPAAGNEAQTLDIGRLVNAIPAAGATRLG